MTGVGLLEQRDGRVAAKTFVELAAAQIETNLPYGSNDKVTAAGSLIIRFIPEPGLLVLLGSGVAGLAMLGRRMRARKQDGAASECVDARP